MKIYLAAKYDQMLKMREVRDHLVEDGHEVTAQWVDGKEANDSATSAAIMDVEDVRRSDALLAFSNPRGTLHTGGGRHVEFGIALERGMLLVVVGPRGEHVFHNWPSVKHCETLDEARALLLNQKVGAL
jgi:hypothetical protein